MNQLMLPCMESYLFDCLPEHHIFLEVLNYNHCWDSWPKLNQRSLIKYPLPVYKISGQPDSQNCWQMPRFLNLGIRRIAMFYTCLYIDGTDAHIFWPTIRFNGIGIRRIAMFFPVIYTLSLTVDSHHLLFTLWLMRDLTKPGNNWPRLIIPLNSCFPSSNILTLQNWASHYIF